MPSSSLQASADRPDPERRPPDHARRQRTVESSTPSRSGHANPLEINVTDADPGRPERDLRFVRKRPRRATATTTAIAAGGPNQSVVLTVKPGTYYILVYNNLVQVPPGATRSRPRAIRSCSSGMNPNEDRQRRQYHGPVYRRVPLRPATGVTCSEAPTVQFVDQPTASSPRPGAAAVAAAVRHRRRPRQAE